MPRHAKRGALIAVAAVPLLLVGAIVVLPLVHLALILEPTDQPVVTGAFGCADVDAGPRITGLDASGNSPLGWSVKSAIAGVQTGSLPGFERVIVYFDGEVPHYAVGRLGLPVFATTTQTGEFDAQLKGRYGLQAVMTWAVPPTWWYGRSVGSPGPTIIDGRLWDTGDEIALLGLGLSRPAPPGLSERHAAGTTQPAMYQ